MTHLMASEIKIEWANYKQSTFDAQGNVLSTISLDKYLFRFQNNVDNFRGHHLKPTDIEFTETLLSGINARKYSYIWHKYNRSTFPKSPKSSRQPQEGDQSNCQTQTQNQNQKLCSISHSKKNGKIATHLNPSFPFRVRLISKLLQTLPTWTMIIQPSLCRFRRQLIGLLAAIHWRRTACNIWWYALPPTIDTKSQVPSISQSRSSKSYLWHQCQSIPSNRWTKDYNSNHERNWKYAQL